MTQRAAPVTLTVSPSDHWQPSSTSGSRTIGVVSNVGNWSVSTNRDWLRTSRIGSDQFVITVSRNTSTSSRSGTVTVTAPNGPTRTIHVTQQGVLAPVRVTGVVIPSSAFRRVLIDTQIDLTAVVLPTNATNRSVTWESSDSSVASVNSSGRVTAHSPGFATITVRTSDGGHQASVLITVPAGGATREQERASCTRMRDRIDTLRNEERFSFDAWIADPLGRQDILRELFVKVNYEMGYRPRLVRLDFSDLAVGYFATHDPPTGQVLVNTELLECSDDPNEMRDRHAIAIQSVIHEARHEFQYNVVHYYEDHNFTISLETRGHWRVNLLPGNYTLSPLANNYAQPIEWDAWNFEGTMDRVLEVMENAGVRPVYEGSWPWPW